MGDTMIDSQTAQARWVLAFDASCATCREISDAVSRACGGKLEALPLIHPDVRQWRDRALGPDAPSAPTLVRVTGDDVRAWTGKAMAVPLARRLGLRASARVLCALGHLRGQATAVPFERPGVMDRARFFQLCAGLAVAAGVIVTGTTPAFAEKRCATAAAWVAKNKGHLPQTYDEVIAYPMAYRRAIFSALSATTKSQLWSEQLTRYRTAHQLSSEQSAVIQTGLRLSRPALFERLGSAEVKRSLDELRKSSGAAFGGPATDALFATLGPAESAKSAADASVGPDNACSCATADSYCGNNTHCQSGGCGYSSSGCGTFYAYACDGLCIQ